MKVMTAMYTIRRGGAYDRFIMMLEAFLEKNCETHCLSLTPIPINHSYFHNHVVCPAFETARGCIAKLAVVFLFPLWSFWVAWRQKIDLIIAFGSVYAFLQSFSKWMLKRPMVTLIRGSSSFGLKNQESPRYFLRLVEIVEYLGLLLSDRIITNNITARDEMLKTFGKTNIDVQILYNNIPSMNMRRPEDISKTREKYGIPENAKVLVTAGILNRGKNIETLIDCLPKIEVSNICILIVGDSLTEHDLRYKNYLIGLAKKLGVDRRVFFTGWLEKEDLWKIYLVSDLFVLPSFKEGMPNALLEALGLDLPCLGSRISGVQDILQYNELMFDPRDENEIVTRMNQFFSEARYSDRIIELCQKRKNEFLFDWGGKVFQMVTQGLVHRGETCQSR